MIEWIEKTKSGCAEVIQECQQLREELSKSRNSNKKFIDTVKVYNESKEVFNKKQSENRELRNKVMSSYEQVLSWM